MIAVGIDISKAKSTVAVINSDGTILASPFTMAHTRPEMEAFVTYLKGLGEPTTILMEYTGHYHYPVLKKLQDEGFPVCIVNPFRWIGCRPEPQTKKHSPNSKSPWRV